MLIVTFDVIAYAQTDKAQVAGARQPIPDGQKLYEALFARYHGRVILLADNGISAEMLDSWAKREGYKFAHVDVANGAGAKALCERVRALHAAYGKIDWYVDTNPEAVTLVMKEAIPCLLVGLPNFVRPEWREDKPREKQMWTDLTREIEVQSLYRTTKEPE